MNLSPMNIHLFKGDVYINDLCSLVSFVALDSVFAVK